MLVEGANEGAGTVAAAVAAEVVGVDRVAGRRQPLADPLVAPRVFAVAMDNGEGAARGALGQPRLAKEAHSASAAEIGFGVCCVRHAPMVARRLGGRRRGRAGIQSNAPGGAHGKTRETPRGLTKLAPFCHPEIQDSYGRSRAALSALSSNRLRAALPPSSGSGCRRGRGGAIGQTELPGSCLVSRSPSRGSPQAPARCSGGSAPDLRSLGSGRGLPSGRSRRPGCARRALPCPKARSPSRTRR